MCPPLFRLRRHMINPSTTLDTYKLQTWKAQKLDVRPLERKSEPATRAKLSLPIALCQILLHANLTKFRLAFPVSHPSENIRDFREWFRFCTPPPSKILFAGTNDVQQWFVAKNQPDAWWCWDLEETLEIDRPHSPQTPNQHHEASSVSEPLEQEQGWTTTELAVLETWSRHQDTGGWAGVSSRGTPRTETSGELL